MGYRCDVIIRCEEKAYKLFQQAIAEGGYKPKEIYQIRQSTTSIGAMHHMGVGECLFLIDF